MTKAERDTIQKLIPLAERALYDTASPFEGIAMMETITENLLRDKK